MTDENRTGLGRRPFIAGGAGLLGAVLAGARPAGAQSAARRGTLVIGLDISDATSLDPARVAQYSNPLPAHTAWDSLVTFTPGDYVNVKPLLATEWAYQPDGKTIRFKLRNDVKFVSGKPMTAEDVRFSLQRVMNLKDQPQQYIAHVESVKVVDDHTVDMVLSDPTQPILTIIAAPEFVVMEKAAVMEHGATDAPDAKEKDTATNWLNDNSAGTGAYRLTGWQRNQQIQMVQNPNYWRGKPGFERVLIRHMSESAAQLLALKRGDIDVAFNLIPEQVATLKDDPAIEVKGATSLDFIYMAVAASPANPALQNKAARQAIGYAIDYDGIIRNLIGGNAVRPVSFLPVGVNGSTEALTKEIGFREDLPRAKKLLADAGLPDGFSFQLAYGNAAIAGVQYQNLAQKIQADLARVGIKAELAPMDQLNLRTMYLGGKAQGVLTFWNPPAPENLLWASATIDRVAKRVHWDVAPDVRKLVADAAAERDITKSGALYRKYQEVMVDQANHFVLIQPIYQVAMRKTITGVQLTAAGWMAELSGAKPV
ncbi:ABC transporter substrate-binding protein [Limobrevibacterium gyesilva]|uniref:ABC transporter substrate-binding protein n=1 Tax=Limobrevibacterium gyesilva TaxID=2991712 RepID=A0AA41YX47_9PROT|nr:ABC transporter substrate-binding protein [Limobrevibacterium gyesilva]MCW3476952.1 ABC transporter substrate-binding protein [Limobrevibacterium gyesilva]